MNTTNQIIKAAFSADIAPLESAKKEAQELISLAKSICSCSSSKEQQAAVDTAAKIRRFTKTVRAAGKEIRDAVRERILNRVLSIETELCSPLDAEQERLERLVAEAVRRERLRVEQERRRAEELQRRAEEEAAKAAALASSMKSEEELEQALAAETAAQQLATQATALASITPNKPKGAAVRRVLRWEVTDIHALYKARPDLVDLRPKAQAIQATCDPALPVPGLKLWYEDQVVVRAS